MADDGGTLELHNGVVGVRRTASTSLEFLKAAAGFVKAPAADLPAQPAKPASAGRKSSTSVPPSIISVNVELGGQIVSPDELHIYGAIEGDVRAAALVICTGGLVRGEVVAESVTVHGAIDGHVYARSVQLCAGGVVRGDIIHAELGIEKGAIFEGVSRRVEDPMADAPVIVVRKRGE